MYTKGEWRVEPIPNENRNRIMSYNPEYFRLSIADVFGMNDSDRANARLIAASPDMYEALEAWQALWNMRPLDSGTDIDGILRRCWTKTEKALAKAEPSPIPEASPAPRQERRRQS